MDRFDFIILGAGASAFAAAVKASELGARTAMVRGPLPIGGTCVNVGCVPSKWLVHAAGLVHLARTNPARGVRLTLGRFDFAEVIRAERDLVGALRRQKYEAVVSDLPNVTVLGGAAFFTGPHEIDVGGRRLAADRLFIATGSTAHPPDVPGLVGAGYLTHITALDCERLPKSLLVLGAGPVGLEFAQIYARFGAEVTLVTRHQTLFPRTEPELSRRLEEIFRGEGIQVLKNTIATRVDPEREVKAVTISDGDTSRTIRAEEILVATGKTPNTSGLNLDPAGVRTNGRGAVVASATMQTTAPHIFAAGDVTNAPRRLETTAGREGTFAAENALRGTAHAIDYEGVPWTVFTDPQLAGVGLLDAEVGIRGLSCTCQTVEFEHVAKAQILGDTRGLIKTVMDRTTRRIVGIHILAPHAGDLIGQAELVLRNRMTVDQVLETLPVFPTLSESLRIGAQSLVSDVSKLSCCV